MTKTIDTGPLSIENVDQQFCSDFLKDEIKRLFAEIENLRTHISNLEEIKDSFKKQAKDICGAV